MCDGRTDGLTGATAWRVAVRGNLVLHGEGHARLCHRGEAGRLSLSEQPLWTSEVRVQKAEVLGGSLVTAFGGFLHGVTLGMNLKGGNTKN